MRCKFSFPSEVIKQTKAERGHTCRWILRCKANSTHTQYFYKLIVFPSSLKKIASTRKCKNATKHCKEHAKPTGGDTTLTIKLCMPIRSIESDVNQRIKSYDKSPVSQSS